jgi:hypothetical protein
VRELQFRRKISTASNKQVSSVSTTDLKIDNKVSSSQIKVKRESALSFLDSIKEVIKSRESDPEKAQLEIELLSIESEKKKTRRSRLLFNKTLSRVS